MKRTFVAMVVILSLAFLPICPIQFQIKTQLLKSGHIIYPVSERKLPFTEWNEAFSNPRTRQEAEEWIRRQPHWFPLCAYDSIIGKFLPLSALPIPRV